MSLLNRRSRSETRNTQYIERAGTFPQQQNSTIPQQLAKVKHGTHKNSTMQQFKHNFNETIGAATTTIHGSLERRKTSAELISEAKILLAEIAPKPANITMGSSSNSNHVAIGGVRLISTRRPVTPREPGRALYGKVALAGRPPSSFSLRYLQHDNQRPTKTPTLESIIQQETSETYVKDLEQRQKQQCLARRSHSMDSRLDYAEIGGVLSKNLRAPALPRKLPALEIKEVTLDGGKQTTSNTLSQQTEKYQREHASGDLDGSNKTVNILTSRKLLQRNSHLLAQSPVERLIELLKEHAGLKDCTDETANHIISILVELYTRIRQNEKHFKRGFILGGLYGLVECSSPKILVAVARVVLALRVTGSNLTGACKLIFKVARNEQNDHLFYDNDLLELLIDGLGRASPLDDPEACIYGYGSIRFLTSSVEQERTEATTTRDTYKNWSECLSLPNKPATAPEPGVDTKSALESLHEERMRKLSRQNSLVEHLARHGAVELMVLHLQILNEAGATQKLSGPPLHSLYQLSATLRALADVHQTSQSIEKDLDMEQRLISTKQSIQLELACPHLVRAAEVATGELEVQANIVRTLSILSEDSDCCHVLANFTARIGMLLGPCCEIFSNASEKLLSVFSRLGYILGNIMAKYDNPRIQFYHNDVAMQYLLRVLQLYSKEPLNLHNALGDTVIDVLIKMIRVVANMSVNSEVGIGLGNITDLGETLLHLLKTLTQMRNMHIRIDEQELLHATLGALHNLCFFQEQNSTPTQVIASKGSLQSVLSELAIALHYTLKTCRDEPTQVEAARVLGNLTRNETARRYFCRNGGLALVVQQLRQGSNGCQAYHFKACAIGVLVNLLGDAENRVPFLQHKGAEMLRELLRDALNEEDWFLATIVCQAFWNLLIDARNVGDVCQEQVLDEVCDLLVDYLEEEGLCEQSAQPDAVCEDFIVVATDLLERIQSSYDNQTEESEEELGRRQLLIHNSHSKPGSNHNTQDGNANNDDGEQADEDDVYIEEM